MDFKANPVDGRDCGRRLIETMDLSKGERTSLIHAAENILHNPEDAEDAVQSALLKAWLHRDEFRGDCPVLNYLNACVRNEALLQLRKRRAHCGDAAELAIIPSVERSIDQDRLMHS